MTNWESPGDTGVITTAEDLAKWTILGQPAIQRLLTRAPLTSGETPAYAFALVSTTRGAHRRIEHGGSTSGYRAHVMMLPDDDLSVAVLCNNGSVNTTALADGVADALLGVVPPRPATNVPAHADGMYFDAKSGTMLRVATKDGQTTINDVPLQDGDGTYRLGRYRTVTFRDGAIELADTNAHAHRYVPVGPAKPVTSAIAGRYHSDEAAADWVLSLRDGHVYASSDRMAEVELKPLFENAFDLTAPVVRLLVEVTPDALLLSDRGVYRLRFTRTH